MRLVWAEEYDSIETAFVREKQVQNWSRAKREALIRGDEAELRRMARSPSQRPPPPPLAE